MPIKPSEILNWHLDVFVQNYIRYAYSIQLCQSSWFMKIITTHTSFLLCYMSKCVFYHPHKSVNLCIEIYWYAIAYPTFPNYEIGQHRKVGKKWNNWTVWQIWTKLDKMTKNLTKMAFIKSNENRQFRQTRCDSEAFGGRSLCSLNALKILF